MNSLMLDAPDPNVGHSRNLRQRIQGGGGSCDSSKGIATSSVAVASAVRYHPADGLALLPDLRERVRSHVYAVVQCLPRHQTQAYMEAVEKDNALVLAESDPLQFVRYCGYDVLAGTKRLCRYWSERRALFGSDKAFLPLVLTGTGALNQQDLLMLRAGFPALLPNATTGHKCIIFDPRCMIHNVSVENFLRSLFYIYKILAEDDLSQVDGVIVLVISATPRSKNGDLDVELARRSTTLVSGVFPVKARGIHLLSVPQQKKPSVAANLVLSTVSLINQYCEARRHHRRNGSLRIHVQTPECKTRIFEDLLDVGLSKKSIPNCFGGEWKQSDFFDWCQERMEWEYKVFKDRLADQSIGLSWNRISKGSAESVPIQPHSNHGNRRVSSLVAAPGGTQKRQELTESSEENDHRLAQRRMEDLIRSRRKRERQRLEFGELKEDSTLLMQENQRLVAEQTRLENLLADAEQCVSRLSSSASKLEVGFI